ncbi:MAG: thiamine phosphate synthase [Terriglobales bacterium]
MADRCLLYYITDRSQFRGDESARRRALLAKVAEAARAGIDYVQLREKDLNARELEQLARQSVRTVQELRTENREPRTRLLINSRSDIAIAAGADGVHLRSDDIAAREARSLWTQALARRSQPAVRSPLFAASCHTAAEVFRAASEAADFAVFAPVFGKRNVPGTEAAGLAALSEACRAKIPVLALGGVNLENAASCLSAGAAGVAGIRLFQENRIEDVVRTLRTL